MKVSALLVVAAMAVAGHLSAQTIESVHGVMSLGVYPNLLEEPEAARQADLSYIMACFGEIPGADAIRTLEEAGYTVHSFVPPSAYILRRDQQRSRSLQFLSRWFDRVVEVPGSFKAAGQIAADLEDTSRFRGGEYLVSAYTKADIGRLEDILADLDLTGRSDKWIPGTTRIVRLGSADQLRVILASGPVAWVDRYAGPPQPETSSNSMFCNQLFALSYDRTGPDGSGTYFGNIEYFGRNPMFRLNTKGRNHPVFGTDYPDDTETLQLSHGSQVSLYGASANNIDDYEDRGMADGATLIQMPSYDSIESYYLRHGLRPLTLNVSAGIGTSTVNYNAAAREFDRITRTLGGFMLCFSAGNDGHSTNPHLNYGPGWANISSDDKTAKNTFTVHSAGRPGEHFDWTCKGPTSDGRLKPDISAEGQYGTSFASPNLAGLVNVLYESYTEVYGTLPRSDVVKAAILNTAIDADKPGIDFKTGFGTVNPVGADRAIREQRIFTGSLDQGTQDSRRFEIEVPAGMRELKVLLYWHDFEGTPGAARALVNDLDLRVNTPDGSVVLPWTLDPTPGRQYDLPLRKRDTLNNVEQVTLTDPSPGTYALIVDGSFVPAGPQDFVVTYEINDYHIEITSPVSGFRTARNKSLLFTWNAALASDNPANPLDIYLETAPGNSVLLGSVPAAQRYYAYDVPGNFPFTSGARVIVRQRNTTYADTSGRFQVMRTPGSFRISSVCPDRISFAWEGIPVEGTKYILYRLGDRYMEPVAEVAYPVTSVQVSAEAILGPGREFSRDEWFAIAAWHPDGALSLRSAPVSVQQTNLVNTTTQIRKNYTLCYGDSVTVTALDLERDSIRWYHDGAPLAEGDELSIQIRGNRPGQYHYAVYQRNGCRFDSDTFHVDGPLQYTDTLVYGPRIWNVYVFRQHDRQQFYGKAAIRQLNIRSEDHYTEFQQIDRIAGYTGCPPGFVYTIDYKRQGFPRGHYTFDLRFIQQNMHLYIDDVLVYSSPSNAASVGVVWQGHLDESSRVRIEQVIQGKALMHLVITPDSLEYPAAVGDSLRLWLRGDHVVTDAEGAVRHWPDSYILSRQNEAGPDAAIRVGAGLLNYNDAVVFGRNSGIFGTQPTSYNNEATTIAVFRMNESSDANARIIGFGLPPYYGDDNYNGTFSPLSRNGTGREIGLRRNGTEHYPTGDRLDSWQMMSVGLRPSEVRFTVSGNQVLTQPYPSQGLFYATYSIGCRPDSSTLDGQLDGAVAEVIHYNRALSAVEERCIQSYLAIKYGMTLAGAYISADTDTIYTPGAYAFAIAGVAREDRAGLYQRQSRSTGAVADLMTGSMGAVAASNRLNPEPIGQDGSYLVWGRNAADPEFLVYMNDSTTRLMRTWKLQHTGRIGIFRFNFDASLADHTAGCTQYTLLLAADAGFGSPERIPLSLYTAGDGRDYLYGEYELTTDTILYATLEKTELVYLPAALTPGSRAGEEYCIGADRYAVLDSVQHAVAALSLPGPVSRGHIAAVTVRTDHTPERLVYCGDETVYSVFNRTVEILSSPDSSARPVLRIYLDDLDSLRAVQQVRLAEEGCAPDTFAWDWWAEPDEATLLQKISAGGPLALIDPEQVQRGRDGGYDYVDINGLSLRDMIIGAVLTGSTLSTAVREKAQENIRVYPNPLESRLYIEGLKPGDVVTLLDIMGREVISVPSAGEQLSLQPPGSPGFLILRVMRGGQPCYQGKLVRIGGER